MSLATKEFAFRTPNKSRISKFPQLGEVFSPDAAYLDAATSYLVVA